LNLLSYVLGAINLFNSDRPHHRRLDLKRSAKKAWTWAQRNPTPATIVIALVGLGILFAILAWGW
jgi:hypothetical protein